MLADSYYIKRTFKLARLGKGYVSPNPLVGSILVKNNRIIGKGYHQKFGSSHAEIMAIESASEPVKGSTLYCNLEPCCHTNKKTQPCAQRIVEKGILRVVISSLDPNPEVNGKGVELLRQAGIEVDIGILDKENQELNKFFLKYITKQLPYISVKIAQTVDGKIACNTGEQTWITGDESKALVHRWRSEYDATFVGANTVMVDNPQLTVREVSGRNPLRIVLDGSLNVNQRHNILSDGSQKNTIIITGQNNDESKLNKIRSSGCRIIELPIDNYGRISIKKILRKLAGMNIASILVEGGQQIFSQFIQGDFVDDYRIFISPQVWGKGIPSINNNQKIQSRFKLKKIETYGEDVLLTYR